MRFERRWSTAARFLGAARKGVVLLPLGLVGGAPATRPAPPPAQELVVVFQDDFESGDLSRREGRYRWGESRGGPGEHPEITDEIAHSGQRSLKFTFVGNRDPRDDAWSEQRFVMGDSLKELYLEWYQYFPTGYDGHGAKWVHRRAMGPTNNKFLALWDEDYDRFAVWMGFETEGPRPDPMLVTKFGTRGGRAVGNWGAAQWSPSITDAYRGRWIRFRVHVKMASIMNRDGVFELWADDRQVVANHTLPLFPRGGMQNYIRKGYLMGWANTGFDETTHTFIDDFSISVPAR